MLAERAGYVGVVQMFGETSRMEPAGSANSPYLDSESGEAFFTPLSHAFTSGVLHEPLEIAVGEMAAGADGVVLVHALVHRNAHAFAGVAVAEKIE